MLSKLSIAISLCLALNNCASLLTGTSQDISVATPECGTAKCTLSNSEGNWRLEKTPGTVTVSKDNTALVIACQNGDSEPAVATIRADYEGLVWGNILIGGLIGLFIDMGTGAINTYPKTHVDVALVCDSQ